MNDRDKKVPQQRRHNITLWVFIGIISYFLIMEHWAHILPFLPYLLLLLCPLMHIFMHGSHGHSHGGDQHHHEQPAQHKYDREED